VRVFLETTTAADFDAFVRGRTPALLRTAYLLTGDQQLAEDLVQSALARTHRVWGRLRDGGSPEAYVRRTMYNLQVSWWRKRRVAEAMPGTDHHGPAPGRRPDDTNEITLRLTLRTALTRLTNKQRAVLVLRFFEDRSEAETAEVLGVAIGTVKSQTAKALARLRVVAPELEEFGSKNGVVG
jgi:RNA polymerase sigma-70 factor (sigma-E family)